MAHVRKKNKKKLIVHHNCALSKIEISAFLNPWIPLFVWLISDYNSSNNSIFRVCLFIPPYLLNLPIVHWVYPGGQLVKVAFDDIIVPDGSKKCALVATKWSRILALKLLPGSPVSPVMPGPGWPSGARHGRGARQEKKFFGMHSPGYFDLPPLRR